MWRGTLTKALVLAALGLPVVADAEIYRWVDRNGKEHFTTDLRQVPASQRDLVKAKAGGRPTINRTATPAKPAAQAPRYEARGSGPTSRTSSSHAVGEEQRQGRPESWWRGQADTMRTDISTLEALVERFEAEGADHAPSARRYSGASRARHDQYQARYQAWNKATQDLKYKRRAWENFQERARRADVPPGWLRER